MYFKDKDWQSNVKEYVYNRRTIRNDLYEDIEEFFKKAFENTKYPQKSWFGLHKSGISLVIGGIYLAAIHLTGDDQGVWLLVDQNHPELPDFEFRPVRSTQRAGEFLIWAHSPRFSSVTSVVSNRDIWISYSIASEKIRSFAIAQDRDSVQQRRHKQRLSEIFLFNHIEDMDRKFSAEVADAMLMSSEQRRKRLSEAPTIPQKIEIKAVVFSRNPDVVAEVLVRSNGFCESCKNPAPFIRRSYNTPYLEVHHIKSLALGGTDSVDNAIALCPNCHRKAHYA